MTTQLAVLAAAFVAVAAAVEADEDGDEGLAAADDEQPAASAAPAKPSASRRLRVLRGGMRLPEQERCQPRRVKNQLVRVLAVSARYKAPRSASSLADENVCALRLIFP